MTYWDKNPGLYKLILILIAFVALTVSIVNIYRIASLPTDDNIYQPISNTFYITDSVYALNHKTKEEVIIPPGSFIYRNNAININTEEKLDSLFEASGKFATLRIYNTYEREQDKYLITATDSTREKLRFVSSAAIIIHIIKGGLSDRAGLKVGDLILKVNGRDFSDLNAISKLVRNSLEVGFIEYYVLRGRELNTYRVEIVRFGLEFTVIFFFIVGVWILGLGLFLGLKKTTIYSARLTAIGYVLLSTFVLIGFLSSGGIDETFTIIRLVISGIAFFIGIPVLAHSMYYIPVENKILLRKNWIPLVNYGIGFIAIISIVMILSFGWSLAFIGLIFFSFVFLILLYSIFIRVRYRKLFDKHSLKQGKILRFSNIFVIIAFIVFANWFRLGLPEEFKYTYLALVIIPISFHYTIAKYRLFDLDLRIRRNIRFIVLNLLIYFGVVAGVIYVILFLADYQYHIPNLHFTGSAIELLEKPLNPEIHEYYERILVVILSIILIYFGYKTIKFANSILERMFFRVKIDYKSAAGQFHRMIENNLKADELAKEIVRKIQQLLNLKRAGTIFFKEGRKVWGQAYYGLEDSRLKEYVSLTIDKLSEVTTKFTGASTIDYLPDPFKVIFSQCEFKFFVPIQSKDKVIGLLFLGEKLSEDSFSGDDLEFLSSISSQISVSVDNALLYEDLAYQERVKHELEIARSIQLASLPNSIPSSEKFDIYGISHPALEVGGDFYDFLVRENEIMVLIGDVSGKGTSAALYMSKAQGIFRTLNEYNISPRDMMIKTNHLLYHYIEKNSFISSIAIKFSYEERKFHVARAGHLPVLKYDVITDKVIEIKPKGIALGITNGNVFSTNISEEISRYNSGDVFLFVTDGITESSNVDNEEYGLHRLHSFLKINHYLNAKEISTNLIQEVKDFSNNQTNKNSVSLIDDMTIVVVKIK